MSYYTFFTVPHDYRDSRDDATLQRSLENGKMSIAKDKSMLKAAMIDAYYKEDFTEATKSIGWTWDSLIMDMTLVENYDMALYARSLKDGVASFNHADCDDKYQIEENIKRNKEQLANAYGDLLCLSRVRFKDDDDHSDVAHTESDYLLYDYQTSINNIIRQVRDIIEENSKFQLWLDCWDSKETEGERYDREHPEESETGDAQEDVGEEYHPMELKTNTAQDNEKSDAMQTPSEANPMLSDDKMELPKKSGKCPVDTRELSIENGEMRVKTNI